MSHSAQYIKDEIYELLCPAYEWLYKTAATCAHWDDVRSTALASICLSLLEDHESSVWMPELRKWLLERQKASENIEAGRIVKSDMENDKIKMESWNDEIWDTSHALLALYHLGLEPENPQIINGFNYIRNLFDINKRQNWHDEPWETAWSLYTCLTTKSKVIPYNDLYAATLWLKSLQSDGRIVAPHYTAYFILIGHRLEIREEDKSSFGEALNKATKYLLDIFSQETLWTGEAWSNGQILWALSETGRFPIKRDVMIRQILAWYNKDDKKWKGDGYWSDVEDTSSSIIGLYSLLYRLEQADMAHKQKIEIEEIMKKTIRSRLKFPKLCLKIKFLEHPKEGIKENYLIMNISPKLINRALIIIAVLGVVGTIIGLWDFIESRL